MKIKDQMPSENVDDNPSGWMSKMMAKLMPSQSYKVEPSDAVQSMSQHSNKMEKTSRMDEYVNREDKGSYKQKKGNRYRPPSKTGGGGGY